MELNWGWARHGGSQHRLRRYPLLNARLSLVLSTIRESRANSENQTILGHYCDGHLCVPEARYFETAMNGETGGQDFLTRRMGVPPLFSANIRCGFFSGPLIPKWSLVDQRSDRVWEIERDNDSRENCWCVASSQCRYAGLDFV